MTITKYFKYLYQKLKLDSRKTEPIRLSEDFRRCLRLFAYYYTNRTLEFVIEDASILPKCDYPLKLDEMPSSVEKMFAVYANNIEMDENGKVLNHRYTMTRTAQFIRMVCDGNYIVEPPFEEWELDLH